jgi:O-antigen ligase
VLKRYFNDLKQFGNWLNFAVITFMMMQFLMPSFFIYSFWFYAAILLPYLLHIRVNFSGLWLKKPDFIALVALFLYCTIHSSYWVKVGIADFNIIRHCIFNALFVAVMLKFHKQVDFIKLMRLMMLVMVCSALISLLIFAFNYADNLRLEPIGQNNHSILGANIYSAFALAGCVLWIFSEKKSDKMLSFAALLLTLIVIFLTQSRGALIAFGFGFGCILTLRKHYITLCLVGLVAGFLAFDVWNYQTQQTAILPLSSYYDIVLQAISRKSHRSEIWELAWQLIQRKPIFGYGLQAGFPYGYAGVHPHNLFISTWYYTGVIGLALLLIVTIFALKTLYHNRKQPLGFAGLILLLHGIVACLTDQGQLMKSPAPLWFIFWWSIAIAYCLSYQTMQKVERNEAAHNGGDAHS